MPYRKKTAHKKCRQLPLCGQNSPQEDPTPGVCTNLPALGDFSTNSPVAACRGKVCPRKGVHGHGLVPVRDNPLLAGINENVVFDHSRTQASAWGWIHCPIPETCGRLSRIVADAEARDLLKSLFLPGKTGSVFPKGIPLPRQVQATGAVE